MILAAAAALVVVPGPAAADKAPRVGIAVSVQVNLKKDEVEELSAALGRALHQKLVVDVVSGREANRRLPSAGVSESCVVDEACIKDTAQRLTADEILFLVAVRVGNRIQVDSTWVDTSTGRSASRPKVVMIKLDEAEARFAESASLILPDATVRQSPMGHAGEGEERSAILVRTTPRRMTPATWVTAGVGVAALGTGVGFWLAARSKYDECKGRPDDRLCNQSERDAVTRNAVTSDISFGVAAASAVLFGVLYYSSGGDIERIPVAARSLRLQVDGQGGAFVAVEGRL